MFEFKYHQIELHLAGRIKQGIDKQTEGKNMRMATGMTIR